VGVADAAARARGGRERGPGRPAARAVGIAASRPENPRPFHRPLSSSPGWKVGATREQMHPLVAAARRCPPGAVYAGPPLVAFIARPTRPGDQPDAFVVTRAAMHAATLADGPRCR
jgi:hypothetical protein